MKVVMMAGGRGTRISGLYPDLPKPLIPIDGKMLLSGMGNTLSVAGLDGGIYIATINNGKTTEKIKFRK